MDEHTSEPYDQDDFVELSVEGRRYYSANLSGVLLLVFLAGAVGFLLAWLVK